jgi:ferredoxin-NADP reductase
MAKVLREHGFHPLRVTAVVDETADAKTFVLEVPADLADVFVYEAGQFCNVRAEIGGEEVLRCYSMSSAPATDADLAITVKRVPGGLMSNWLHDNVVVGTTLELMKPSGEFVERPGDAPMVGFCGGSGVTPVFAIAKQLLATTSRSVRVLYANRDRESVIFHDEWARLQAEHGDRLSIRHHLDAEAGFLAPADIVSFLGGGPAGDCYICGPGPFMDVVEAGLAAAGVARERISIERFVAGEPAAAADPSPAPAVTPVAGADAAPEATEQLTIIFKGKPHVTDYTPGDTVLDAARRLGLKPPYSCELGNCASCMALVKEGAAHMRRNTALRPNEVEEGWVLTCQARPVGRSVVVEYEHM